jgi:hypothetical protein
LFDLHHKLQAIIFLGVQVVNWITVPLSGNKIRDPEIARVREALVGAGLLDGSGKRLEAA